ncbi:MAG: hypothetical protein ACO28P_07950, partial [Ilumatobacteraceae bacterium]
PMNTGFVIEHNIRTRDGRILPPTLLSSAQFGAEVFHDLTIDEPQGSASTDRDLDGVSYLTGEPVRYDRTYVIL